MCLLSYLVGEIFNLYGIKNKISVVWVNRSNLSSLPAHSGHVGAAGMPVPGAVGITSKAALSAGLTVQFTLVQAQLGHSLPGAYKQPLLETKEKGG